ncbi:MAG: ABC transporter ATP-binding protein [Candidatus Heimdallarchaeota archaeon]|nr:MAG: ABC transporter ATP-binding protein [Candidatus Heimdallarchaeota archaeon]
MSEKIPIIRLENLTKKFGDVIAVNNINLDIYEGEILTLLGPSGCGKSTTLRSIAGLEKVNGGEIYFKDQNTNTLNPITDLAARKRDMAMVFQSYALWPHMSVQKNIEFGLTIGKRRVSKEERIERVKNALKMVYADELINRKPSELSGGQQQRIAVARAIVVNPSVLLLDEPFSNLDAKLRVETRSEIRALIKKIGLTAIFVTHDQSEALSISDRIAIMNEGLIEQIGSPIEIWQKPHNSFVGAFIGEANLVECNIKTMKEGKALLCLHGTDECFKSNQVKGVKLHEKAQVILRPQMLEVYREKDPTKNQISGKVIESMFMGTVEYIKVELPNNIIITIHRKLLTGTPLEAGEMIFLGIDPDQAYAYGGEYKTLINN